MSSTVLFAGGGTGGHIVPNLAVVDVLRERGALFEPHFLVSEREIDAKVLADESVSFTTLSARPLAMRPNKLAAFSWSLLGRARAQALRVIRETQACAVVASGGFVSAPVVLAAKQAEIPLALVSLDAVPGKANRMVAPLATCHFSAYPMLSGKAKMIGPVLRPAVRKGASALALRQEMGMDPERPLLLVFGGSQGGGTINDGMMALLKRPEVRQVLAGWQVLHLAGVNQVDEVAQAWKQAGVPARVETFVPNLARLWRMADLAVCRAGAGSVGEAWAGGCPCIFMPYPWHRDQHQAHNAAPLVEMGGSLLLEDRKDGEANALSFEHVLLPLLADPTRLESMRHMLCSHPPSDGAEALADWVEAQLPSAEC